MEANKVLISYYIRKKWYQHIQDLCEGVLDKRGSDSTIQFWRAYAIGMEGRYAEAIRELDNLKNKRDAEYACISALIFFHNQCKLVDHEEVAKLELLQTTSEDRTSDGGALLCAYFFWHANQISEAKHIIEKLCRDMNRNPQTPMEIRATILHGWIDLTAPPHSPSDIDTRMNSIEHFQSITTNEDPELLIGMAKYFEMKKQYAKCLEYLDQIIVRFPWFEPALSQKASILLKTGDWDLCIDTAERALSNDKYDIEALRLLILFYLTREGKVEQATTCIKTLHEGLRQREDTNAALFFRIGKAIARISDKNPDICHASLAFIQRAIQLEPDVSAYVTERGYHAQLMGEYDVATDTYRRALKMDESSLASLEGLIYCHIKLGQLRDASQQMEFLEVISSESTKRPMKCFLQALLAWHVTQDRGDQLVRLQEAIQRHMEQLKVVVQRGDLSTYGMMEALDPIFLIEIAQEFIQIPEDHVDSEKPAQDSSGNGNILAKGVNILEKVIKKAPGFTQAQLYLAQAKFKTLEYDQASRVVSTLLKIQPSNAPGHLLQARIALEREQFVAASSSLEQALSYDFAIRNTPSYHLIKAKVLEKKGDLDEAKDVIEEALNVHFKKSSKKKKTVQISLSDQASIYIQMAEIYGQLGDTQKASDVVAQALQLFRGTSHEVRVLVASSELAIKNHNFDAAIKLLNNIPQDSSAFHQAQLIKANVYLKHRRDQRRYIQCFKDLTDLRPTLSSYVALAEAHVTIHQLDEAVSAFQHAFDLDETKNVSLACRIGATLISMHDYTRAIAYYESALAQAPDRLSLRYDLAELYHHLKRDAQALATLDWMPPRTQESTSLEVLCDILEDVQVALLRHKIHSRLNQRGEARKSLESAEAHQTRVCREILLKGDETSDFATGQHSRLADICLALAEHHSSSTRSSSSTLDVDVVSGGSDQALVYYQKALKSDPMHTGATLALAKLCFKRGELEACQGHCITLLRLDSSNHEAATVLADLMFQKADYVGAVEHFQILFRDAIDNFTTLSRFIMLLRRAGKLDEIPPYFRRLECQGDRLRHHPGYFYCQGLFYRYTNNVVLAIEKFNFARRDGEWGTRALTQLVELYISSDGEQLWESPEVKSVDELRMAEELLAEIPAPDEDESDDSVAILRATVSCAKKTKSSLEQAASRFIAILEASRDNVSAMVGLAITYMLQKQESKARNQLKRIAKMHYDPEYADAFELSYLLLADIYVGKAKYDLAQELCRSALEHNVSSGKAWTCLGSIMEKEHSYKDAAESYERAWKFEGEASATTGYKLAFNYLKAERYVDAIDVCQKVLRKYPDYPIQADILHKAWEGLRP